MNEESVQPPSQLPQIKWHERKWVRNSGTIFGAVAVLYAMIYVDVVLRAREAYLEGEKYMSWHQNPELKKSALNAKFEKEKAALDKKLAGQKIKKDEYDRQLEIIAFDRDRQAEESSLKYAVVWYQTAYELFSPPESKWVKLSREKAPAAKEMWKDELRSKKIHFEDYMLE